MNTIHRKSRELTRHSAIAVLTAFLVACGGSSGSSNDNPTPVPPSNSGDLALLAFSAPNIVPSLPTTASNAAIIALNTGEQSLNNLSYSLSQASGSGAQVTLDNNSCQTIAAHSQCTLNVHAPAGAVAGSFAISARQTGVAPAAKVGFKRVITVTPLSAVGIQQIDYNTLSGADGISLYYAHEVNASANPIIITGVVTSTLAGNFNNINLVDGNGIKIPNQQVISGNLGAGFTNLNQGTSFAISLNFPAASPLTQIIKLQTELVASDGSVSNQQLAKTSDTLSLTKNQEIINFQPDSIYLTAKQPQQTLTIYNSGDSSSQLSNLAANHDNLKVSFSPSALAANGITTASVELKDPTIVTTSGNLTLNYSHQQATKLKSMAVTQNLYPASTPTPTPSPEPTPLAGLSLALTPASLELTTAKLSTDVNLTLTNVGNRQELNFVMSSNPANAFQINSVANTSKNSSACTVSANKITNSLSPGMSCNLSLHFTSPNSSAGSYPIQLSMDYDFDSDSKATPASIAINSNISQSSANLSITPSTSSDFGSIMDNNQDLATRSFLIHNSGEVSANELNFSNDNPLFRVVPLAVLSTPACSKNLAAGADCTLGLQFGPIANGTQQGSISSLELIDYSYASGGYSASTSVNQDLSATIIASKSAVITLSNNTGNGDKSTNGFGAGNGSTTTPYQLVAGQTAKLTYSFSNNGHSDANSFYVSYSANPLPTGWSQISSGCELSHPTSLKSDGSNHCDVVLQVPARTTPGNLVFDPTLYFIMNYLDLDHPQGVSMPPPSSDKTTVAINYVAPAQVSAVLSTTSDGSAPVSGLLDLNSDFYAVFSLQGGAGETLSYGVDLSLAPGVQLKGGSAAASCTLTSAVSRCSIGLNSGSGQQHKSNVIKFQPLTSGPAVKPASQSFDIYAQKIIFVTQSLFSGNFGGNSGADAKCNADINKKTSDNYKALLTKNTSTTPDVLYLRADKTTPIVVANTSDLVDANTILDNSITRLQQLANWSGLAWIRVIRKPVKLGAVWLVQALLVTRAKRPTTNGPLALA